MQRTGSIDAAGTRTCFWCQRDLPQGWMFWAGSCCRDAKERAYAHAREMHGGALYEDVVRVGLAFTHDEGCPLCEVP